MIQVTPQMRVLVAVEPADFRKGSDGLSRVCKPILGVIQTSQTSWRIGQKRRKFHNVCVLEEERIHQRE